jgi:hypothetical protein
MSSHRVDAGVEPHAGAGVLHRLLDPIFGYFIWAAHLLVVYISAAVACQLGLGTAAPATQTTFTTMLALVTVGAAAIVVLHAVRRHRQNREALDEGFLVWVMIGNDAIASVGIVWQLYSILLVPVCE